MADETLVIEIKADTSGLEPTISLLEKLGKIDAATAEQFRKATSAFQAQQNTLKQSQTEFKKTGDEAEKAGKKIAGATKDANKSFGDFINTIKGAGAAVGIGLGVAAVVAFGKESFKAFTDAEKTAKVLQTAVGVNGGLQRDFEALIEQSKELQKTTIFSDDNIQKVQTMALQFGLTTKQVQNLLPTITDFASATGQTLEGALEAVLRGTEGMARGLKIYGVQVLDTGTKQEKLANITQQLTDKFAGQAEVVGKTTFGATERLKNQFNDLQEEIGGIVADVGEATAVMIEWVLNGFKPVEEHAELTGNKLDELGKKILGGIPKALIQSQIAQLRALGAEIPNELIEQLKQFNLDEFNNEIQSLDDKTLVAKLKNIETETIGLAKLGDLSLKERLKIINDEIAARKASGKLIEDQNQEDEEAEKKRLQNLKEQQKAQEELRKFTLEQELKNIDESQVARQADAVKTITDTKKLQDRLVIIEFEALQERIKIKQRFGESTLEEDSKVNDLILKNTIALNDAIAKENEDAQERRLKKAKEVKESIDDLSKSESDLSKKSLSELLAIIKAGTDAGLKGAQDVADAQKEIADRAVKILESLSSIASEIGEIFANQSQAQIDSLESVREAQQEQFDADSEALQNKLDRDLITQAQFENQSAELKKRRAADEKRIDQEQRKIKQEAAERQKAFDIFQTIINTARAIVEALPSVPLSILVGAVGALQLAKIISTPIPKFAKGIEVLKGRGTATSDSIPAMLSAGEGVMPADINKEYRAALSAIYNRKVPASLINNFVRMKLDGMPQSKGTNIQFPEMLDRDGVRYGMKDALGDGISISNTRQIAQDIVDILPTDNPRRRI